MQRIYDTSRWKETAAQVRRRDGDACLFARLMGGCSATLHVHHIQPVADDGDWYDESNLVTVCARHHPMIEAFRRMMLSQGGQGRNRCGHFHRTREAREDCERRLARNASVNEDAAAA